MEMKVLNQTTAIIPMEGEISLDSEINLKTEITEANREYLDQIVLDFRPLDHIDNEGMTSLVKLVILSRRLGIRLLAFGLNDRYRRIFDMAGLTPSIPEYTYGGSSTIDEAIIQQEYPAGKQDDTGWAPFMERLIITEKPEGALTLNMHQRRINGPLNGFGTLWQKVYTLKIDKPSITPAYVISALKQHFPEFQPDFNWFYPTSKGILPGQPVFIDSKTPGGIISTGVMVLYADDTGFSLVTPTGHPIAGWVSFNARQKEDHIEMKIRGIASASDPIYEAAFRLVGSDFQEQIWVHVLKSLAQHLSVPDDVEIKKVIIDKTLHWNRTANIWYNAQIRSIPWDVTLLKSRK